MYSVSRKESMTPDGYLKLVIQEDGDVFVHVAKGGVNGGLMMFAGVEFCTPSTGGGGSTHTHGALHALAVAMARDNADALQQGRAGDFKGEELLKNASQARRGDVLRMLVEELYEDACMGAGTDGNIPEDFDLPAKFQRILDEIKELGL